MASSGEYLGDLNRPVHYCTLFSNERIECFLGASRILDQTQSPRLNDVNVTLLGQHNAVRKGKLTIAELEGNVETYRNPSKKWRNLVTMRLMNRVCTSSQRFQDSLFDKNAIPP